jgi:hypothetical protein
MVEDRAWIILLTRWLKIVLILINWLRKKDDKILKLEAEMSKLKKKFDEVSENLEVEKKRYEIA